MLQIQRIHGNLDSADTFSRTLEVHTKRSLASAINILLNEYALEGYPTMRIASKIIDIFPVLLLDCFALYPAVLIVTRLIDTFSMLIVEFLLFI